MVHGRVENLTVDKNGLLKLPDFTQKTEHRQANYHPPEYFINNELTAAGDIWTTGCLLYELMSGEKPFSGEMSVLYDIPAHLAASYSRKLRLLVWQML